MNHQDVLREELLERYVRGQLDPGDVARFEEHYLACQECLDQLALEESLARGFKRAAGQEMERQAALKQLALVSWVSRLSRSRQAVALGMAALVVALLPTLFAVRERAAKLEAQSAYHAREENLAAEAARLGSEVQREQEARALLEQQLAASRAPQGNVPILFLNVERGSGEPSHRVRLPAVPGWVVLVLEIDPPLKQSYSVVLCDPAGKEIWRGTDLALNQMDALSLSLPSTLFAPGDYELSAAGLDGDSRPVFTSRFRFRALPALR